MKGAVSGRTVGRNPASAARFRATTADPPSTQGVLTGLNAMQIVGTNGRKGEGGAQAAAAPAPSCNGGSQTDRSTSSHQSHQRSARNTREYGSSASGHRTLGHDGVYPPQQHDEQQLRHGSGPGSSRDYSSYHSSSSYHSRGPVMDFNAAFAACVKVFCTSVAPCYALPWVRGEESHTTGSGFAVVLPNGDRRLLTHAQVLENHCLVQVRRASEAQKYVAQVDSVGYDVDIALLVVEDEQFWRSIPLLPLPHGLPAAMSEVLTAGFPAGGEELATTRGVVNRILLGGQTRELCVQMDAPINPGNNGGPVLNVQGQLVGMACSGTQHAAGFMVPLPVIHTFLENAAIAEAQGHAYAGKSVDHYRVQPLENPELRMALGLPARPDEGEDGGVLLSKLGPDAVCEGVLVDGDVLLAVDGSPIAPDGTVMLPEAPSVRVGMRHCVQRVPLGTRLEYLVLRDGKREVLHVTASARKPRLLPPRQPVPRPEWLVLGGLVFCPLLPDYEGLIPKCQLQCIHGPPTPALEEVVVLLRVLQSEVNIGYEDICGMLKTFNGAPVRSLAHLAQLSLVAEQQGAGLLEFMLVTGELLVLDAARCWETELEIFSLHTIPRRCSFDVLSLDEVDAQPPA